MIVFIGIKVIDKQEVFLSLDERSPKEEQVVCYFGLIDKCLAIFYDEHETVDGSED
jgi:hypothetical protein